MSDDLVDELGQLIADVDQHEMNAQHLGRVFYAEWRACVDCGMPELVAAVLIANRYKMF